MKKIIVTGPESSGKTTLFNQLTKYYQIDGVNEYAREFIGSLKREYNYNDILEIAKVQFNNEQKLYKSKQRFILSDTDLLTLEIWCEFKYEKCHQYILNNLRKYLPDVYLLCNPDIPWEYDPQRENPDDRLDLFNTYENKIKSLGVEYHIIEGEIPKRFESAKRIINNIYNS
tara:strand:- start:747 stop:1262 length:516 start_codon:yes stop_codon:yes gene_type:complete